MATFFNAAHEYEKDKDLKVEDVKSLMDWASEQQHLPKISECQMILFLQSSYFNVDAAKIAIEKYFTVRTQLPEIFQNRDVDAIAKAASTILVTTLPEKTPEGFTITFVKYLDHNPDNFDYIYSTQLFDMVITLQLAKGGCQKGHVMMMDAHGQSFRHLLKMNFGIAKKFSFYQQEALPLRLKAFHIINASAVVEKMFSMFKPFISEEIFNMVHIHVEQDNLYKYIPQRILPIELGGESLSLQELKENTVKMLLENRQHFKAEELQIVDENKRMKQSTFLTNNAHRFKILNFD